MLVGQDEGIPATLKFLRRIEDRFVDCGPLGALEALLSSGIDREYFVVPCDMPYLTRGVISLLMDEKIKPSVVLAKRARFLFGADEEVEPLIGRYPVMILPRVRKALTEKKLSMREFVKTIEARNVYVPEDLREQLFNANTPLDIKFLFRCQKAEGEGRFKFG